MHFYYIFNRPSQEWWKPGGNGPSIFFRNRKEYLRYLKKIFISGPPPLPNPTRFLDLLPPMTCQENLGQIQVAIKIQIPEYCGCASEKNCLFISISRQSFGHFHWTAFSLDPTANYENMTSIYLLSDRITSTKNNCNCEKLNV